MNANLLLTCPYCSNEFKFQTKVEGTFSHKIVVTCDIDETPGCDQMFAIVFKPEFFIMAYKMDFVPPGYATVKDEKNTEGNLPL